MATREAQYLFCLPSRWSRFLGYFGPTTAQIFVQGFSAQLAFTRRVKLGCVLFELCHSALSRVSWFSWTNRCANLCGADLVLAYLIYNLFRWISIFLIILYLFIFIFHSTTFYSVLFHNIRSYFIQSHPIPLYSILFRSIPFHLSHLVLFYTPSNSALFNVIPSYSILLHSIPHLFHSIPLYPTLFKVIPFSSILFHFIPLYPRGRISAAQTESNVKQRV